MTLKFRLVRPYFVLDVNEATGGEVADLIDVLGFVGHWRNPSHIAIALVADIWLIPMNEVEETLQDAVGDAGGPLGDAVLCVWLATWELM